MGFANFLKEIKYFGTKDPIGQSLLMDNDTELIVTGILKDIPSNSHLRFDFLASMRLMGDRAHMSWSYEAQTYVLLQKNVFLEGFAEKISGFVMEHDKRTNQTVVLHIQPLSKIHLYSLNGTDPIIYVYIFLTIAIAILIIACINFINLSTARSNTRAKEIGLRKVVGAEKSDIISQFTATIVLIIGTIIMFKQLNYIRNKDLGLNREHVVAISMNSELREAYRSFKNEIKQNPNVINVTAARRFPTNIGHMNPVYWEGKGPEDYMTMTDASVDYKYFTFLAILISCLGLFGMASFTAEQRTKEIGIRKILGASITNIIMMISKDFLVLLFVSNVIAWPIAYFLMERLLNNYAYRTNIALWIFLASGMMAILVALLTVCIKIVRTAYANPVDSLRYE